MLRQHHVDRVPISGLCNQNQLQTSVFYTWQRHLWVRITANGSISSHL